MRLNVINVTIATRLVLANRLLFYFWDSYEVVYSYKGMGDFLTRCSPQNTEGQKDTAVARNLVREPSSYGTT